MDLSIFFENGVRNVSLNSEIYYLPALLDRSTLNLLYFAYILVLFEAELPDDFLKLVDLEAESCYLGVVVLVFCL